MALFTSVASGDFDADATWDVGSGFPGALDTFLIAATHVVTIPVALAANSTGTLTGTGVGANVATLTIVGSLKLSGNLLINKWNVINLNAGATLDLDGNDMEYFSSSENSCQFIGTPSNRCKVISTTIGGRIDRDLANTNDFARVPGNHTIQYCDFTDLGDVRLGSPFDNAGIFIVTWVTFTGCGSVDLGYWYREGATYQIENVDIRDSTSTTGYVAYIVKEGAEYSGGVQIIKSITANEGTTASAIRWNTDHTPHDNIIVSGLNETSQSDGISTYTSCFNNYRDSAPNSGLVETSNRTNTVSCYLFTDADNPHSFSGTTRFLTDSVIEATYATAATNGGDHMILSDTSDGTVTGTVVLDSHSGTLINGILANSSANYLAKNNTLVGDYADYGALAINETSGQKITGVLDLYDNIIYNKTPEEVESNGMRMVGGDDEIDSMDYNAWHGFTDIYHLTTSATKTPGVTVGYGGLDLIDIEPNFVDTTRNLSTWAFKETGTSTSAAGIAHLMGINGYDAATKSQIVASQTGALVTDLVAWVREGYTPTNQAYNNTGSTGTWIGAMEPVIISGGSGITRALTRSLTRSLTRAI